MRSITESYWQVVGTYTRYTSNITLIVTDYTENSLCSEVATEDRQLVNSHSGLAPYLNRSMLLPLVCWKDKALHGTSVDEIANLLGTDIPIYVKISNAWCARSKKGANAVAPIMFSMRGRKGDSSGGFELLDQSDSRLTDLLK